MPQVHITYQDPDATIRYIARSPDGKVHRVYLTGVPQELISGAMEKAQALATDPASPPHQVVHWGT